MMPMTYSLDEKYEFIKNSVINSTSTNPVEIAKSLMNTDYINIHGPEHHFLDGAVFLTAYKNAGGNIDLPLCLDELAKRALTMPGAMCGYWGVCGSVASVGAALSIIHNTGPLSTDNHYKEHMEYTSEVIQAMSKIGGARCCKRNAFLSLLIAANFVKKKYGINMDTDKISCDFSNKNAQCLKYKCPFHVE